MNKDFEWDEYYSIVFRIGLVISLAFLLLVFIIFPKEFFYRPYIPKKEVSTVLEQLPPELEQIAEPPPAERPKIAVVSEAQTEEEAEEASKIGKTEFTEIYKKTEETEIPIVPFWKVEVKPKEIYLPKPVYPEIARQLGHEGDVVVEALVDIDGSVADVRILKSSGNPELDKAALEAARQAKFTPAKQRDMPVRVWVSIPYKFRLR
jgi:protein TonB